MQYEVPQFIEVEDKIFGPLTFKQFAYLAGAGGISLIFFSLFPLWLMIFFSLPFVATGVALAFYKVNDRPLINVIEHGIRFYFGSKLYLWKQVEPSARRQADQQKTLSAPAPLSVPNISESKLKDLAWSLNIKDRERMGVTTETPTGFEI